jgi:glyoxylase-like metal-dependent hydrolase (beta-lactamase superfamily II)
MSLDVTSPGPIAPEALVQRLADGERLTIVDIRSDASWGIDAPTAEVIDASADAILADPVAFAAELRGPVVVVCNRGMTAQPVAQALSAAGLRAAALEGGMRGWIGILRAMPVETDIPGLEVRQVQRPGRGCLSYLLARNGEALAVDPAPDADFYLALAEQLDARITSVVDTHLHADHLSGARELAERSGAALRLPAAALERGMAYADRVDPLRDGDTIGLGGSEVRAVALPGHTTDMTGFLADGKLLIGGDSLFADGIARPDLQRGDPKGARAMARMLHGALAERVGPLDDGVRLLPGHTHPGVLGGPVAPTLGEVRGRVPELAIADSDAFAEELLADMPPRPANYESVIAVNAGSQPFDPELETGGNSCATR